MELANKLVIVIIYAMADILVFSYGIHVIKDMRYLKKHHQNRIFEWCVTIFNCGSIIALTYFIVVTWQLPL